MPAMIASVHHDVARLFIECSLLAFGSSRSSQTRVLAACLASLRCRARHIGVVRLLALVQRCLGAPGYAAGVGRSWAG